MDLKQALILIFAGIGGTLGFSLIFRMRKKLIVWSLLGAALTLGVYVLCLATMQHAFFQNLFPALAGALFAEVTAKLTKSPATQYLACAIIPLVPGGGLYYTMYHFVTGDLDAFHAQLTSLCRQKRILRVIDSQDEYITRFSGMAIRQVSNLAESHKEHYQLVDYVEKKDLEGFRTLMAHHIDDSKQMCLKALKEQFKEQNRA